MILLTLLLVTDLNKEVDIFTASTDKGSNARSETSLSGYSGNIVPLWTPLDQSD